ncbi:MAG TPA: TetR family transcriptional regulator [Mycobacteriales bacterium]|nr:TetR family transcriptional regulator [Mycobacteriales bacterium]HWA67996.1 TetR family transcriptional regulator [Mycobacteriales bacterium]
MSQASRPAREPTLNREVVVEAAVRLVEEFDLEALTMRRLAAELGTAVTSIYWHVGNRDALLDLMVYRLLSDMADVTVNGRSPRARITSLCKQWRRRLWEHPHLIAVAHERGKTAAMFQPMQAALARELHAVGLRGRAAATAIRTLQLHVVSSVVIARTAERGPATAATDPAAWPAITDDPDLIAALAGPVDYQGAFDVTLDALLYRFVPTA